MKYSETLNGRPHTQASSTTVRASPIAVDFAAWYPPDASTIKRALQEGLVILDANILLQLYRYDEEVTGDLFGAGRRCMS